jgi:hypothetical protein
MSLYDLVFSKKNNTKDFSNIFLQLTHFSTIKNKYQEHGIKLFSFAPILFFPFLALFKGFTFASTTVSISILFFALAYDLFGKKHFENKILSFFPTYKKAHNDKMIAIEYLRYVSNNFDEQINFFKYLDELQHKLFEYTTIEAKHFSQNDINDYSAFLSYIKKTSEHLFAIEDVNSFLIMIKNNALKFAELEKDIFKEEKIQKYLIKLKNNLQNKKDNDQLLSNTNEIEKEKEVNSLSSLL